MSSARTVAGTAVIVATSFLATTLSLPRAAHAQLSPAQKCAVAKEKAAAKKAADKIKCYKKAKFAAAVDPTCLQKADDTFAKAFAKAEAPGGCQLIGDADFVEAQVDTLVSTLVQALQPTARAVTPPQRCAIAKLQAASSASTAQFKCYQQNVSVDSDALLSLCLSQAEQKLELAFAKAENLGACAAIGDLGTISLAVHTLSDITVQVLRPFPFLFPTPGPTPSTTGACSVAPFVSNTTWNTYAVDPVLNPGAVPIGNAQDVCLAPTIPSTCPGDATIYGGPWGVLNWSADLSIIPGANWIWAPNVNGTTAPADSTEFYFSKTISIPGAPTGGSISIAADNFGEIRVNGSIAGSTVANQALTTFSITQFLHAGSNTIVIHGKNGAGCGGPCPYSQNPAGVVFGGSITCTPRFVDNGDGTITDKQTGLMWEKKDNAGGEHDLHKIYNWSTSGTASDGTAFTVFLAELNTTPCFAGHCDWRLPQLAELESILAAPYPCGSRPCVPAAFNSNCTAGCSVAGCSCTEPFFYWSDTIDAIVQQDAWLVSFSDGDVPESDKRLYDSVRAVR